MKERPNEFSDFLSPTTADEGPVKTRNIPGRQRTRRKTRHRKKRRDQRAS